MGEINLQTIASRRIVYETAGSFDRREHAYRAADGSMQPMDIHYPSSVAAAALPAVVMVVGYPDSGMQRMFGRQAKDLGSNVSWAELMAASGLAVVTYANVSPWNDAIAVFQHLRQNGAALGIDPARLGVWACSGNVPTALGLLMGEGCDSIRCAALLYGYMLDVGGSAVVKEMSKFGFVTPADGKSVEDLPPDLPLFIARAGRDEMPRLNETVDAFITHAIARNLPITVANHHNGPHAFDAVHDSEETRRVIRRIVTFLVDELGN